MTDQISRHFALVDELHSITRLRAALDCLETAGVHYIVVGGWAVATYGSPVPSVDLDCLVIGGLSEQLSGRIEAATGLHIHSERTHEVLALDIIDANTPNALITHPELTYVPRDLTEGKINRRGLPLLGGRQVPVPQAPQLAFTKLKAFHDRRLQWQAAGGQRHLLWSMPEMLREQTLLRGEDYWLRKAGKDLFDASLLCRDHTTIEEVAGIAPPALWHHIMPLLRGIPVPLRAFAQEMAVRAKVGSLPLLDDPPP